MMLSDRIIAAGFLASAAFNQSSLQQNTNVLVNSAKWNAQFDRYFLSFTSFVAVNERQSS